MPKITITGQPPSPSDQFFGLEKANIKAAKLRAQQMKNARNIPGYTPELDLTSINQDQIQQAVQVSRMRERAMRQQEKIERETLRSQERALSIARRQEARAASAMYPSQHKAAVAAGVSSASLGTLGGAYYNQEIRKLGGLGTSAINRGDLKELILIDRHLAKMDKNLEKYVKSNGKTSQEQQADRKKAREILAASYTEVSAAAQFAPGVKGMAARAIVARRAAKARTAAGGGFYGGGGKGGGGFGGAGFFGSAIGGGIGDLIEGGAALLDPLMAGVGIAAGAYELPHLISGIYGGAYSAAKPYIGLRRAAGKYGLNAGAPGANYLSQFYRGHGAPPALMRAYGLSASDAFGILNQYGIVPQSSRQAAGVVGNIARMSYMPGLAGLGLENRISIARMQGEYGGTGYTKKFQKIMEDAVTVGTDRARVFQSMRALLQQNVAQGALTAGAGSATSLYNRMLSSGAPGARTGVSEATFSAALGQTAKGLGTSALSSIPVYRMMMARGGVPNTATKLQSLIGAGNYKTLMSTPAGRRLAQDIITSPNAAVAARYLGVYYSSHQSQFARVYQRYGYFQGGPQSLQDLTFSSATGASLGTSLQYLSGYPTAHGAVNTGAAASPLVMSAIKSASAKTGLPVAALYGLIGGESTFRIGAVNGSHIGLGQMGPAALKAVGMSGANMRNPKLAALASAKYLAKMYGLFGGHHLSPMQRLTDAYDAYYWGPGHASQILAGQVPSAIAQGTARKLSYYHSYLSHTGQIQQANQQLIHYQRGAQATAGALQTTVARNASETLLTTLESFNSSATTFANATANFNASVIKFAASINNMHSGLPAGTGYAVGHLGEYRIQP